MFKLLKNLTKKDILAIIISFIFIIVQVWLELKMPDYMTKITDLVMTDGSKISDILVQGGYMLLCAFGSLLSSVLVGYLIARMSANFSKNTRKKLYDKVISFSIAEIKKFNTSSLITRTTNDITNIQMFISMGLQLMIKSPIMAIWAITKILNRGIEWSIATAIAIVFLAMVILIIVIKVLPKFKIVQNLIDNINELTRENLTGIRVIRAFNAEKYQVDKFNKSNEELTSLQKYTQRFMSILSPSIYSTMNLLTLAIYVIGASLISSAGLTNKISIFSDMVVFSSYAMQVIMSFLMLAMMFIFYPRASVSAKRINEVLDTKPSIKSGNINKSENEKIGEIEFRNVSFKYPDSEEYVLNNISFKANKGDTVAFIGSTGSGKSTLINLIPRFYDATEGEILIDGVNIKDYKLSTLYDKLGYVPQKAIMFDGSIKDNVAYGKKDNYKFTDEKINKAIKIAEAEEFVSKMEDKENSHIASGGTNLSGGQKQRLAIARAIAREPEIYIFDDSFSALDYKTDFNLRQNLKKYTKDATCIIVAQRIGTIMNADTIVVLDNGKVVGLGKHEDLMKNCEVYQEIAYSQLSKEELENE